MKRLPNQKKCQLGKTSRPKRRQLSMSQQRKKDTQIQQQWKKCRQYRPYIGNRPNSRMFQQNKDCIKWGSLLL